MPKFRQIPKIIEAEQYFDGKKVSGVCLCEDYAPHIHTIDDRIVELSNGDWVIPEADHDGYFYVCKAHIFRATYEAIEE